MKVYHIDRAGTLKDGQRVELHSLEELPKEVQDSYFVKDFKYGVSAHGLKYLNPCVGTHPVLRNFDGHPFLSATDFETEKGMTDSTVIEVIAEIVRRCYFPSMPSRMVSLFAVKERTDFEQWPELRNEPKAQYFQIEVPENTHKFDSNLLRGGLNFGNTGSAWYLGFHASASFDFAYRYWSGETSANPRFEYLVQLPTAQIHKLNV